VASTNITGINEYRLNNNIAIYPNPGNGKFTIQIGNGQLPINNYQLSIYNVFGEKVYSTIINNNSSIINLDLPTEIYFLQLKIGQSTAIKKLIINRHYSN
jgi:hypothetical protein